MAVTPRKGFDGSERSRKILRMSKQQKCEQRHISENPDCENMVNDFGHGVNLNY